jgi:hypothetical protein
MIACSWYFHPAMDSLEAFGLLAVAVGVAAFIVLIVATSIPMGGT